MVPLPLALRVFSPRSMKTVASGVALAVRLMMRLVDWACCCVLEAIMSS